MTTTEAGDATNEQPAAQAAGGAVASLLGSAPRQAPAEPGQPAPEADSPWWQGDAFRLSTDKPDGDALADSDWLANKKYGSFAELVKAHRALESKIGEKGLILPKAADDPAWADVWKALGRPDDPKGYEIPLPEGDDGSFAETFRPVAHQLGLNAAQVKGLAEWFNGLAGEAATLNAEAARTELQAEWKDRFGEGIEFARRAQQTLQLDDAAVEKIATGYGLAPTLKLLAMLGRRMGEGGGLPGGKGGDFQPSLQALQARKQEILASPELARKLAQGDPGLQREWKAIAEAEAAELSRQEAA